MAALSWSERQSAIACIGEELARRGWQLFGYTEDRSDAMTDYYSPAAWDGVATHPDLQGVVVCVGVNDYTVGRRSRQDEAETRYLTGDECPRCHGSGVDPLNWTLEAARREPQRYHREMLAAEHGPDSRIVNLTPSVVSPIPFNNDGRRNCVKCSGRGHALRTETHVRCTWPAFHETPKGKLWHVERDGGIAQSGTGYARCRDARWGAAGKQAVREICDAIEAAARQPAGAPTPAAEAAAETPFTVEHERDWTWIMFAAKPEEAVRMTLKGNGARWSKRRSAWYLQRHVEEETVRNWLGA